jgi:hypothetical protein
MSATVSSLQVVLFQKNIDEGLDFSFEKIAVINRFFNTIFFI